MGRRTNLMLSDVKIFLLNVKCKDLNDWHYHMLVNKLLGQLDLNIKLCQTFIVLNEKVLSVEERHLVRIVCNL